MAQFACDTSFSDLSENAVRELKIRILDGLGCAIGALGGPPVKRLLRLERALGKGGGCTLIGGGKVAPDRAAFCNGALVRYLDFNDSYLAKGETCHPSDNIAPVMSASEYVGGSGKDLLTSLAVAYQVQCRLSDMAPVRGKGFDHTTQGSYAVAAGASRAMCLDRAKTANAIAISGTALNALRVTRTGKLSNWKGLAYPFTSFGAIQATLLARAGITGPLEVFEGNKGFIDTISGPFEIDWKEEDLEAVTRTVLKEYNAEMHSQSAVECTLRMRERFAIKPEKVRVVRVRIFDVAYNIIGGGEEGAKVEVSTKEEADHSLPYILAVALLDGQVTPAQYSPDRINRSDVQSLLRRVLIAPDPELSGIFPKAMPCVVSIELDGGKVVEDRVRDYEGFFTRPMTWGSVVNKFEVLAGQHVSAPLRKEIVGAVDRLEEIRTSELTSILARVH
ncbi:MAG: MmgE/PrpD family protein [Nitrososphaerota archaeon]|nr:MmgE/PrpD family protein [Nitrososphaerota archaeon]MDG7023945.1 MmgE/PrpD family protein [Nitrososphaerota archaeon]